MNKEDSKKIAGSSGTLGLSDEGICINSAYVKQRFVVQDKAKESTNLLRSISENYLPTVQESSNNAILRSISEESLVTVPALPSSNVKHHLIKRKIYQNYIPLMTPARAEKIYATQSGYDSNEINIVPNIKKNVESQRLYDPTKAITEKNEREIFKDKKNGHRCNK